MNRLIQLMRHLLKEAKLNWNQSPTKIMENLERNLSNVSGVDQKVPKIRTYVVNIKRSNLREESLPINTEPISKDILVLPTDSISTFNYFVSKNLNTVYPYLLMQMGKAVKHNVPAIEVFRLGQTNNVMRIEKQEFEKYLLEMQMYFAEQENFEKAGTCTKLLDAHRVNLFLDSN